MHSLFSWALPLALAGSAIANPMLQRGDACLAAVTGNAALGDANLRSSHCSSFIKTIVTPAASTVTVTVTSAPSPANNGWNNNWPRDVTICPNEVPNYASACSSAAYKSACSVWGIKGDTTTTIPATTTTKTVIVGGSSGNNNGNGNNGFGGFGGQGGVCTSTKTNVITATTTVSACSGGKTTSTSTVTATTTSVTTALSTVTVGNAPQITFTTTTTTSVGTVTSTVLSTTTAVVGAGSIATSTVTTTSTAKLTTTAVSTTTVTVGAASTATVSTTISLATTTTATTTATTTVTAAAVTTTQTLALTTTVTANATAVTVTDPAVTVTVTAAGTTGATTGTPSTGNCLNAAQAQTFVDAFTDLLEYTSYNGTSAPPGRGYHYNVSATYLAEDFQDFSDSINWMAGYNLGTVTFPSRAAFDYGQGLLQPELQMTTLSVDFGCKTVHWRWSALTSSYAHVTGINYLTITDDLTQIQTNFAEFNNANWVESFSPYNPSISCVVPGGLTAAQKRSPLPHSY